MNNELIERIDQAIAYFIKHQEAEGVALLRDCKAALNKYHEQQQGLIGSRARLQTEISIAESLIEDPNYEMSAMEFEYESSWLDKLKAALTQQQEVDPVGVVPQDVEEFIASESCYDPEHPKSSEHDYILVDDLRAWMAGHVRVPVEPTEEMAYAGIEVYGLEDCADADVHAVWDAMINAAKKEVE